jgi:hypothetical protein
VETSPVEQVNQVSGCLDEDNYVYQDSMPVVNLYSGARFLKTLLIESPRTLLSHVRVAERQAGSSET